MSSILIFNSQEWEECECCGSYLDYTVEILINDKAFKWEGDTHLSHIPISESGEELVFHILRKLNPTLTFSFEGKSVSATYLEVLKFTKAWEKLSKAFKVRRTLSIKERDLEPKDIPALMCLANLKHYHGETLYSNVEKAKTTEDLVSIIDTCGDLFFLMHYKPCFNVYSQYPNEKGEYELLYNEMDGVNKALSAEEFKGVAIQIKLEETETVELKSLNKSLPVLIAEVSSNVRGLDEIVGWLFGLH